MWEASNEKTRQKIRDSGYIKKDVTLAVVLNLLLPGAGFWYFGIWGAGFLMLAIGIVLYCILVLPGIGFAVFLAISTYKYTNEYNLIVDEEREKAELEKRENEAVKKEETLRTLNIDAAIETLLKKHKFMKNGILTENEFVNCKTSFLEDFKYKKIVDDTDDILEKMIKLKELSILNQEDLMAIKKATSSNV